MCNEIYNPNLAPLNEIHLKDVINQYPDQADFAIKLYEVLSKNLTPQVNLFVTFVVLKNMFDKGITGIFSRFGNILYVPLSVVAKTNDHEWTRFRPKPVDELHTSFLSFMMAKPNRDNLNVFLSNYGLCFSQGHCCGILFGKKEDIDVYEKSELFAARNIMRSYAESMAMPVEEVDFDKIPFVTSDLGRAEREFYRLYEETFSKITIQNRSDFIDKTKEQIWDNIIDKIPNESILTSKTINSVV